MPLLPRPPLADGLQLAARQVAENLKELAREAVKQVKASAADSTATVKDEVCPTAADVKDSTRQVHPGGWRTGRWLGRRPRVQRMRDR